MARILIAEDEENYRLVLSEALAAKGHDLVLAADGGEALERLRQGAFDLVITDYQMPGADGLRVVREAKGLNPACKALMITGHGSIEHAVEAMRQGADDYLTKASSSFSLGEFELKVARLLEQARTEAERDLWRAEAGGARPSELLGASPAFAEVKRLIAQAGPSRANILVLGETGSGKEGAARALHAASDRAAKPFLPVNCAAYAPSLLESELFGHEKGAFTGATALRKGRLELADGGTLFLDEVGDLPLEAQVKLLRALETKAFERVGGTATLKSDFRLISATHRDLKALVREGRFREDLYFRIAVFILALPPLRSRGGDILLLARHFLARQAPGAALELPDWGCDLLLSYEWPGNVRELQNVIERAVLLSSGNLLRLDLALSESAQPQGMGGRSLPELLEDTERRILQDALRRNDNNQTQAAKALGIERSTLQYKLKKYRLG